MNNIKQFQDRLIRLREERKFSQTGFAKLIGISRRMMCYYEKESNTMPSSGLILKMAQVLECSVDDLLDLTHEPKTDGRTAEAKFMKKFSEAAKLPEDDRNILIQMLDALLVKNALF